MSERSPKITADGLRMASKGLVGVGAVTAASVSLWPGVAVMAVALAGGLAARRMDRRG